jgi:sec-independent protein translocase protein TatA
MLNLYAFGFGAPVEWIFIGGVILLIFGPKKLPEFARSLGKSVGELKKGLDETKETFNNSMAASTVEPAPQEPEKTVAAAPATTPTTPTPSA